MLILAMKLTTDIHSIKIVYEKKENLYMRSGDDGFKNGKVVQTNLKAIIDKWGFRKIDNPPEFKDADELLDNLDKFSVSNNGMITYSK
jgi:hypothetical protein